jgi:hypothetical protein
MRRHAPSISYRVVFCKSPCPSTAWLHVWVVCSFSACVPDSSCAAPRHLPGPRTITTEPAMGRHADGEDDDDEGQGGGEGSEGDYASSRSEHVMADIYNA